MKKLLLLIMLLPFFAMAQTGELKPIGAKSLQTPNNATFHFSQGDSIPGINMGAYGYANLITKEYQRKYLVPYSTLSQIKEFSGFVNNEAINVSYNHTNRTVTLTGDLRYQWQGRQYQLTSPWTSSSHTATAGSWFLSSSDGINFTWSQTQWSYFYIHVCFVNYNASNLLSFATREVHGATMDWQTHFEFHNNIGTFKLASDGGGIATVGTYILNTATDAATTPGFNSAIVYDEDIKQSINALTQGTYNTMYVLDNTTSTFNTAATFPFLSSGSYIQLNDITAGTMSNGINNRYYNVYDILLPTASDGDSQKYRHILLQPQTAYLTQAAAEAENTASLQYGSLSNLAPEFFVSSRITYATSAANGNTGKCTIASITYITGNKANQVNIAGLTPTNHTLLTNLGWTASGHTGTINTLAGFDGTGLATNVLQSSFAPSSGSANYIQNQLASAQLANSWIIGDSYAGKFTSISTTSNDVSYIGYRHKDAIGRDVVAFDTNGRLNLANYTSDGAVVAIYNNSIPVNNMQAGHYAFCSKNDNDKQMTIGAFQGFVTNISELSTSSKLLLSYMSNLNTSIPVAQPNKSVEISDAGMILPSIPLQATTAKLTNLTNGYLPYHISDASGLANSRIYTDGTKIGILTTAPLAALQIGEKFEGNGDIVMFSNSGSNHAGSTLSWNMNTTGGFTNTIISKIQPDVYNASRGYINYLDFYVGAWNNNASVGSAKLSIGDNGKIGINNLNPQSELDVTGRVQATTAKFTNGAALGYHAISDATGVLTWSRDTLWTTVPISDETTSLTTGTVKRTFRMPVACTLLKVRASVTTAPTGSTLIFDINENGTSVLSTKLSIDASEKTSKTAATQPVISDTTLSNDSEMTIDIDQIGSTIAGSGAKITLYYFKN